MKLVVTMKPRSKDDQAIIEWLYRQTRISKPKKAIEKLVDDKLAYYSMSRSIEFPIDLSLLGSYFKIMDVVKSDDIQFDALLKPVTNGFIIDLKKSSLSYGRLRFSWAHELIHSFFYDTNSTIPRRGIHRTELEEDLCDWGASILLLPTNITYDEFNKKRKEIDSIGQLFIEMSRIAQVSIPCLARRLIELELLKKVIISGWQWHPNTLYDPDFLKLNWWYPSYDMKMSIMPYAKLPEDSKIVKAFKQNRQIIFKMTPIWIKPRQMIVLEMTPVSKMMALVIISV
jgi:hypothetical protein